jgi:hypothetical protein
MQRKNAFWEAYWRPWGKAFFIFAALQACTLPALISLPPPLGLYLPVYVTVFLLVTTVACTVGRYVQLRHHLRAMKGVHEAHERELRGLLNG